MRGQIVDWLHLLKFQPGVSDRANIPAAALRDLNGNPTSIDEHLGRGRWTVVLIWASSCYICASEVPRYGAYHASAPDPKFSILGIALDGYLRKTSITETMSRWNMNFPSLVAEMPALKWACAETRKTSVFGTPTFMVFDPRGRLRKLNVGPMWISELEQFICNRSQKVSPPG